jgi:type IV pilus assembly protein PilX
MRPPARRHQRGAVLIVALLFLTILTILGVTAMTTTTYEERLAGNARDSSTAFQAAEAALRDARRDLNGIVVPTGFAPRNPPISGKTGFGDGTDVDNGSCGSSASAPQTLGLCRPYPYNGITGTPPPFNNATLTNTVEFGTFTGAPKLVGVRVQPRYYIEIICLPQFGSSLGDPSYCNFYRITGKGWGLNPNTQVTVQEVFLKM